MPGSKREAAPVHKTDSNPVGDLIDMSDNLIDIHQKPHIPVAQPQPPGNGYLSAQWPFSQAPPAHPHVIQQHSHSPVHPAAPLAQPNSLETAYSETALAKLKDFTFAKEAPTAVKSQPKEESNPFGNLDVFAKK